MTDTNTYLSNPLSKFQVHLKVKCQQSMHRYNSTKGHTQTNKQTNKVSTVTTIWHTFFVQAAVA